MPRPALPSFSRSCEAPREGSDEVRPAAGPGSSGDTAEELLQLRGLCSGMSAGKPFPRGRAAGRVRGGATPPPGRVQCVAAGPRASSRSFHPASTAGPAGRPRALAMRPLLLLAPLGWLLLAKAKEDAKPEGENSGRGTGC